MLVGMDNHLSGFRRNRYEHDLIDELFMFDCRRGTPQILDCVLILVIAAELVLRGSLFPEIAHCTAGLIGIFQSIKHHMVEEGVMFGAVALACLWQHSR
ncbi:hypothetical protein LPJGGPFB_04948 [Ensifer adhaerens]|nr:hypothetical protein [Ensifer adhaerens]